MLASLQVSRTMATRHSILVGTLAMACPNASKAKRRRLFLVVDGNDDTDRTGTTEGWLPTHSLRSHTVNTNSGSTW